MLPLTASSYTVYEGDFHEASNEHYNQINSPWTTSGEQSVSIEPSLWKVTECMAVIAAQTKWFQMCLKVKFEQKGTNVQRLSIICADNNRLRALSMGKSHEWVWFIMDTIRHSWYMLKKCIIIRHTDCQCYSIVNVLPALLNTFWSQVNIKTLD